MDFFQLGSFVCRRRWWVIAAWLAAALVLRLAAPSWSEVANDGDLDQLPAETTTARATALNAAAFPDDASKSQIVLVFARPEAELTVEDRQYLHEVARAVAAIPDLPLVDEPWTESTPVVGDMLKSPTGKAQRVVVRLTNDLMAVDNIRVLNEVTRVVDELAATKPKGLEVGVTGSAAIGGDMLSAAAESLRNTDRTTVLLVVAALLLIYRSLWLPLVPLAAIAVAVVTSLDLLALLAGWSAGSDSPAVKVFTTTRIFVVVLLFGAGTDYCLFLIARFRELRAAGRSQDEAVTCALGHVGLALAASALTTVVGLAMMAFAEFGKFSYSGPAIAVSLLVALAVCVTLAPALLATRLGAAVGADTEEDRRERGLLRNFWERIATPVLRRPVGVLAASLVIAAPLAAIGWNVSVTYDIFGELSPQRVSRRGATLLQQYFPPGEVGPLVVLAERPQADLAGVDGRLTIASLTKPLEDLPGVDKVRSAYRPTGARAGEMSLSIAGFKSLAVAGSPLAEAAFISQAGDYANRVTRVFVVLTDHPFSTAAVATVEEMERTLAALSADPDSPWHNAKFELLGSTSGIRDLEQVTLADRTRIQWLVAAAVLAVLLVLLRRPATCLYLIATVLLSYLVTLGIVQLILGGWYGADYPGLDWKVPVFLFVILTAVGQDYNIYLVTRVFEEQQTHGPQEGLRRAFIETGGIITSCGVIMAATFASMLTGTLRGMVEMGLALSLGIALDTFVVRTVLVPAFLALLARRGNRG
ncbi:MAG: MMPL family transporter [Planctomycetales bacterium]|nr:MMPL family transporter [Planctomycetales bacterium]